MSKEIMKCPLCGSSVIKMKNFNTDEYWYKCTGYKDKGCHFALNDGYTSAEIYLQGEKLNTKCMGCGEPLTVACGPYGLYARCYKCNYDLEPHEIHGETIERWANNRSPKVRSEIKELRLEFKKELKEDKNYGFDEELEGQDFATGASVEEKLNTCNSLLEDESEGKPSEEVTSISQFYKNVSHFDKIAYALPPFNDNAFRKLVKDMELKEVKKVGRCSLYLVSDLQQVFDKFKMRYIEHEYNFSVNDSDILDWWKLSHLSSVTSKPWSYQELEYELDLKFKELTNFEEALPVLSKYELTIGYILRWIYSDDIVKVIPMKDTLEKYCKKLFSDDNDKWAYYLEFDVGTYRYKFSRELDDPNGNILWEEPSDLINIGPFVNSFSDERKSEVLNYLLSENIKIHFSGSKLDYCRFYITKELAEECKSKIIEPKEIVTQDTEKNNKKPVKAIKQPIIIQQITNLLSGKINPEDKNKKWARDEIYESLESYYKSDLYTYYYHTEGALNTMRIKNQLKIVGYYIRPGNHRVNLLYQLSDSPFKEEKVVELTAKLSSATNFYKTHLLTPQGKELFEKEVLPNLKSYLTKHSTTYSITYSKKLLAKAYKDLPDEYKLTEEKVKKGDVQTITGTQLENSTPSTKLIQEKQLIKVEPQTSLLFKVKNFFNRKSPKLDSEFIEF